LTNVPNILQIHDGTDLLTKLPSARRTKFLRFREDQCKRKN
jgi:hypothetical protein